MTGKTIGRVALGALAAWLVPFGASRFVPDWNWPPRAFVLVYLLFFAVGLAIALIGRRMSVWSYQAAVAVSLVAGLGLAWSNLVHVADSGNPANLVYYGVLVVGLAGAVLTRLRARGLAWTLFAMAGTLAAIALVLPSGAPPELARNMAIGHAGWAALFAASGLLFRHASSAVTK